MNEIKIIPPNNFWRKFKVGDTITFQLRSGDTIENEITRINFYRRKDKGFELVFNSNEAEVIDFDLDRPSRNFPVYFFNPQDEYEYEENKKFLKIKKLNDINLKEIIKEIQVSKYQLFLDMDGVITDFRSRYEHYVGKTPEEMGKELQQKYGKQKGQEAFWDKVDPLGTKFWSEMHWTEDGQELWNFIKPYKPKLLSSPSRSKTSVEGKKIWVEKNIPGTELILKQASQKQTMCVNERCILIDDRTDTCEQWKEKGGISVVHRSTRETIKELEKLGFKSPINEIKVQSGGLFPDNESFFAYFTSDSKEENTNKIIKEWSKFYKNYLKYWKGKNNDIKLLFRNLVFGNHLILKLLETGKIPTVISFTKDHIPIEITTEVGAEYNLELPEIKSIITSIPEVFKLLRLLMYRFQEEIIRNGKPVLVDKSNIKSITEDELISFLKNNYEINEIFTNTARKFLNEDYIKEAIFEALDWGDFNVKDWARMPTFRREDLKNKEGIFIALLDKDYKKIFTLRFREEIGDGYFNYEEIINKIEEKELFTPDESYELEYYEPYQKLLINNLKNIQGKELNEIKVRPKLNLDFWNHDKKYWELVYNGKGGDEVNEIMRVGAVYGLIDLGRFYTFRPTGVLVRLIPKKYFEVNEWNNFKKALPEELAILQEEIENGNYKILT